jgi:hypothetical protein
MTSTAEEQLAVLYALRCVHPRTDPRSVVAFVLEKKLLIPRPDDNDIVSNGQRRIENRIYWIRQDLKELGELDGSEPGHWFLNLKGESRLASEAICYHREAQAGLAPIAELMAERMTPEFLGKLRKLGAFEANRKGA